MARGRVVVPDLAAPERIQPTPVAPDMYARPAAPPIDNDLERLSHALGYFNSNLQAYGRAQEADDKARLAEQQKLLKEQYEGDIYQWKSQTTSAERWQAYLDGSAPHQDDIIAGEATKKLWAQSAGDQLGKDIDADLSSGGVALDDENFNPEKYVLGKAKPYLEQMNGRPDLMKGFAEEVDGAQRSVRQRYQTVIGQVRKARIETLAGQQIEDAFDDGTEDGLQGDDLMKYIRSKYVGLGPRALGGSLDIGYDKLDELTLKVLKEKAKDPAVAEQVIGVLEANRSSLDGDNKDIGSLSSVLKHGETVAGIKTTALATLADQYDKDFQRDLLAKNVKAFDAQDGSFSTITEAPESNPWNQKDTAVGADKQKEAAAMAWLRQYRQSPDYDPKREVLTFMNNAVKHPEFFNKLESTFQGIGNTNLDTKGNIAPDQVQKVMEAGNLYETLANTNYAYTDHNLSDKAKAFFETYHNLLRYAPPDTPAEAIAAQTIRAFSSEMNKNPDFTRDQNERIATGVTSLGGKWFWQADPDNTQDLFNQTQNLARIYVRANGGDVDKAVQDALARIKETSVTIHGRVITGAAGVMPGDEKNVERILDGAWKNNEKALKALGATGSEDLSVYPLRDGSMQIGIRHLGIPAVNENHEVLKITPAHIAKLRKAEENHREGQAIEEARKRRLGSEPSTLFRSLN